MSNRTMTAQAKTAYDLHCRIWSARDAADRHEDRLNKLVQEMDDATFREYLAATNSFEERRAAGAINTRTL